MVVLGLNILYDLLYCEHSDDESSYGSITTYRHFEWSSLSSSSIGTATLVGYGLLNYRWVFSAERFLQSAVASGASNPQLGGPVIRTFQLPPPGVPHVWNDASETPAAEGGSMGEIIAGNFAESGDFHVTFGVFLSCRKFTTWYRWLYSPPKEGVLGIYFALKNPTASAGYQR